MVKIKTDPFDEFQPVHFGHFQIGNHQFDRLLFESVDRQSTVCDMHDIVTAFLQQHANFDSLRGTILGEQNLGHLARPDRACVAGGVASNSIKFASRRSNSMMARFGRIP